MTETEKNLTLQEAHDDPHTTVMVPEPVEEKPKKPAKKATKKAAKKEE
tara:strand:+ start:802 stop:945 length:144 start_codon:yes stop_codon:yes gene_type:complete